MSLSILAGCQSNPSKGSDGSATQVPNATLPTTETAPDTKRFSERELDGGAVMIDGTATTAKIIVTGGESRRPVAISDEEIVFASRHIGLQRWQIFEANVKKGIERRISYDAGDVEPVGVFGNRQNLRLLISSSSRAVRSSSRLLSEYQNKFRESGARASTGSNDLEHELLMEIPAAGKRGTVWLPISREPASRFVFGPDAEGGNGYLIALSNADRGFSKEKVFRLGFKSKKASNDVSWHPMNVQRPTGVSENAPIVSVQVIPEPNRVIWANGSAMWTTDLTGKTPERIGDDTLVVAGDLAVDTTGQWIVFSTPTANRGLNLAAIHRSGKCFRNLTEIPGDEYEPSFAPNSLSLFFTQSQGGVTSVARVPFATESSLALGCR